MRNSSVQTAAQTHSVRLGPQAIVVNPYPAGPRTQFPASLIENDGPFFLVRVNKTRSRL